MSEELRKGVEGLRDNCVQLASEANTKTKVGKLGKTIFEMVGEKLTDLLAKQEAAPPRLSEERVLCIKLDAICAHLNHPNPIQSTDVMTAVKLAEDAAEWARFHIEERGRQNDELRAALASVPQPPPAPDARAERLAKDLLEVFGDDIPTTMVAKRDRELIERGVRATIERVKEGLGYNYEEHSFGEFLRALDVAAIVDKALKEKE